MQRNLQLTLLCLFVGAPLMAQPLKPGQWRTYTSMRNVRAVATSSDGQYVWAATSGGAFRTRRTLNGLEFDSVALRTTDGLTENELTAVATDDDGNTYVGGRTGAFDVLHADGTIEKLGSDIRAKKDLPIKTINSIFVSGDTIVLATAYGVEIYRKGQGYYAATAFQLGSQLARNDSVRQALIFHGTLFAAMRDGLAYIPLTKDVSIAANWSLIKDTSIGSVMAFSVFRNALCVGTTKALFIYSEDSRALVKQDFDVSIDRMAASPDTLSILSAGGEVFVASNLNSISLRRTQAILPTAIVLAGTDLILGTAQHGVATANNPDVTSLYPEGPIDNLVKDIDFGVSKDRLYYCSGSSGFGWFDPSQGTWKNIEDGTLLPRGTTFTNVLQDSVRDLLWLVTEGRLYTMRHPGEGDMEIDTVKRIQSGLPPSTSDATDQYLRGGKPYLTLSGDVAIPTWAYDGTGLSILDKGSRYHFTNYKLIDAYAAWGCVTQDLEGNFWAGGQVGQTFPPNAGLAWHRMDNNAYGNIGDQTFGTNSVHALLTDQDDEIWCGTANGLHILSNPYATRDSKPSFYVRKVALVGSRQVRALAVDGVGNKWVGTDEGIFVVSADGSDSVAVFNTSNSPLIDNVILALAIDGSRGEAYATTPSGISRFSTIFKQGRADYSTLRVFPNPIVQTTEESPTVYIDGLMAGSTVKIFTLNRHLVKSINASNLGSTAIWNGRDDYGHQVPSGEYLISATTPNSGEHGTAKVVIIRK